MNPHVLVAVLILSLAAGTASLIVLAAAYRVGRSASLGLYALFSAGLLVMAARTLAVDYLSLNTGSRLSAGLVAAFFRAPAAITALMVGVLPLLAHRLVGSPLGRSGDPAFGAAAALLCALTLTPLYAAYERFPRGISAGPAFYPVGAALMAMAAYAVALTAARLGRVEAGIAPVAKKGLAAFAAFLPFLGFDLFYRPAPGGAGATPFLPGFFPLFLIAVSAGSSYYGIRYLTRRRPEPSAPESSVLETLDARLGEIAEGRGLTARERDVARLALRGASSKEIAGELGISKRTADNHLYRLYGKLGIESRNELTSLLSGRRPAD